MDRLLERVLCATDLGWRCEEAIKALTGSGAPDVEDARLLHVMEEGVGREGYYEKGMEARDLLMRSKDELDGSGIPAEICMRQGRPADEILDEAAAWGATLIVMSTEERGLLEEYLVPSSTLEVVRRSAAPVLVFRHKGRETGLEMPPSSHPGRVFRKALMPVDLPERIRETVERLERLSDCGIREVILVHVVEGGVSRSEREEFEVSAEAKLAMLAKELKGVGVEASVHVHSGNAGDEINSIAAEEKASVIIMDKGRSPVKLKTGLGDTAKRALKRSPVPVLFLP